MKTNKYSKTNSYSYKQQLQKDLRLLNEQKISQESYDKLFFVSRSIQTDLENIPSVKELDYLFCLLILVHIQLIAGS